MGQIEVPAELHTQRVLQARQMFFQEGLTPEGLVKPLILSSWQRCLRFGLDETGQLHPSESLDRTALKTEQSRHQTLLSCGRPILEHVYEQIRDSGSMVILADSTGLLLDTVGDPDFVDRADRVALSAGASWDEMRCGTNAIGTALAEEEAIEVLGSEHYLGPNHFLSCCASPIFSPNGQLLGVLDISGDYRSRQGHTLGLVRISSALIEKRLFETAHSQHLHLCFHERPDDIGTLNEGMVALSAEGEILAINRRGLAILKSRPFDVLGRDVSLVFETPLATLIEICRHTISPPRLVGKSLLYFQIRGDVPNKTFLGRVYDESETGSVRPAIKAAPLSTPANKKPIEKSSSLTLGSLSTGDPQLQQSIERARRILGRDIPLLIQGESGAGKEMFAQAFHASGPRRDAPFVALNCAAIPETLIESELFGYQGGAFTGARKEGAPGKIQQANGGTLFLDEIGDMPLSLQARLLRVLQERMITPLGSTRMVSVDISLVCATHRNLRHEVASGRFREDLYYRLNGLTATLPPLRQRTDLPALIDKIIAQEKTTDHLPTLSPAAKLRLENYAWPGNLRQLHNVLRVTLALLDEDELLIQEHHLPEELLESPISPLTTGATVIQFNSNSGQNLEEIGRLAAQRALQAAGGNLSAAARQLGISRNTLYRKLGKQ